MVIARITLTPEGKRVYAGDPGGMPAPKSAGAVGFDLRAAVTVPITLLGGQTKAIPTGVYVEMPKGFELQVRSRSGLAANHQVFVLNAPGTIDSDYRGEVFAILHNAGGQIVEIGPGTRIAQAVPAEVPSLVWQKVSSPEELSETARGTGKFGSTGVE